LLVFDFCGNTHIASYYILSSITIVLFNHFKS
jgi:hypothetical protein